ncbi:MAG: hypothetical protein H0V65_08120, partial [Chitinophagales bacterium]|nr:hypothetical protein [Chitinophagales bacterium]
MKNLLILTGFITGAFFTLLSVGKYISFEPSIEKEERGINDAMSWWYNVRSNQQTGKFDVSAILAAEKQADEMSSTRNLGIQWEEMGPDNIGGRTRAVLYDRNNEGVIFAGGVSGGLWKSVNGGDSWQVVNDMFEALTVTCLTQASSGDIYFGTGEALYSFGLDNPTGFSAFGFPGKGIWKSSDGGNTFTHLTSTIPATGNSTTEAWAYVTRLAASIDDPNRIYAAMNSGLKISTDGGASWFDAIGTPLIYAWDVKIGSDGYVHAVV